MQGHDVQRWQHDPLWVFTKNQEDVSRFSQSGSRDENMVVVAFVLVLIMVLVLRCAKAHNPFERVGIEYTPNSTKTLTRVCIQHRLLSNRFDPNLSDALIASASDLTTLFTLDISALRDLVKDLNLSISKQTMFINAVRASKAATPRTRQDPSDDVCA